MKHWTKKHPVHEDAGKWYKRHTDSRYHPMFPIVTSDETVNSIDGMRCTYAGYKIYDTRDLRGIDSYAPDRWRAVQCEMLGADPRRTMTAQSRSLLLEAIDRYYVKGGARRFVRGCAS
jgi:hypothetical protein